MFFISGKGANNETGVERTSVDPIRDLILLADKEHNANS